MKKSILISFPLFISFIILITVISGCKSNNESPLFEKISIAESGITFSNQIQDKPMFNLLYYLYFYNGGGVSIGDINNDGLDDIYFSANTIGNNKLYLNKGNFKFEDITEQAGVKGKADWCSGITMVDVNADGFLDIYVSTVSGRYNLKGHNELYINNQNNTFTESSEKYGLNTSSTTTQTAFFDFDRDGDLDCYMLNQSHHPHANVVDTIARLKYDSLSGDRFFRNDITTTGKFTDISVQTGIYQSKLGYGLGIAIADFNNDGWEDIYIGNDFHENDYYYINTGKGNFIESGAKHFGHYSRFSMGNDAADFDNDGQIDIVTVDMLPPDEKTLKTYGSDENADIYKVKLDLNGYQKQYSRNCLQRNNGNGISFSEAALQSSVSATDWSWAPLFADFDNDGIKDLFVSTGIVKRPVDLDYIRFYADLQVNHNANHTDKYDETALKTMPDGKSHPYFFKGSGGFDFNDKSAVWGSESEKGYFTGAAYADLDNDGDLDMVINAINQEALILKNNQQGKNYVDISLQGDSSNPFAIGAKVYLFTRQGLQMQQLQASRGFQSSVTYKLHFGLDSLSQVDSVLVVWANQQYQILKEIPVNKLVEIKKDSKSELFDYSIWFPNKTDSALANGWTFVNSEQAGILWKHKENDFLDYNVQYLIPHLQSTRGPKIAVGDINNDGLSDLYLCGAKEQPGRLLQQMPNGKFMAIDEPVFNQFALCEDIDAVFFDANGDNFQDLWVVSGGNQLPSDGFSNISRLFINDGKGHFMISQNDLPKQMEDKGATAVADIDHDGDMDIFVGHLSNFMKYGLPQSSYLYLNDGKGGLSIASQEVMNLLNIGLVSTASFSDINNDGWPDLVLAGEWMPFTFFINNKGRFTKTEVAQSTGLWQTIFPTDINQDGYIDFLAGNWGHNSKLWSGKISPLKLYVKDFDNNARVEQILCYTLPDGKQYTFLAKDELERAIPVLKKAYLTYKEVAGKDVQYMFYDLFKDYVELTAETLSSSCFVNDGKGGFTRLDLPPALQLAPVFSFEKLSNNQWIAGGNFYGTIPYEGQYDALQPTVFRFDKQSNNLKYEYLIPVFNGEVRDIKWIKTINEDSLLMIARNNNSVQILQRKTIR